jgi:peroxiredoxin Q/BCP
MDESKRDADKEAEQEVDKETEQEADKETEQEADKETEQDADGRLPAAARSLELPNVGAGPDPATLSDLAAGSDVLVLLLQRDHFCTNCREQVRQVAARYDDFRARSAAVASVLPEPRERAASWQADYDLPYALLADPDAEVGAALDQPVRFGFLGSLSDFLGRMPEAVVLDARDDLRVAWTHRGSSTFDRPDVDDLLAVLDDLRA